VKVLCAFNVPLRVKYQLEYLQVYLESAGCQVGKTCSFINYGCLKALINKSVDWSVYLSVGQWKILLNKKLKFYTIFWKSDLKAFWA